MRLLLISYYFPPCGGAAVQRWLRWLPVLVERGFEVTVLTTSEGDYPVRDESLLALVPTEVSVIRVRSPRWERLWQFLTGKQQLPHGSLSEPARAGLVSRILVWARLNLIIPDIRRFWNPAAYKAALSFLRTHPVDVIITTGPPHSTQLLGLRLKKKTGTSWVADWRDPWSAIHYLKLNPPGALSMKIHRYLERKVAQNADLNIAVSRSLAAQMPEGMTAVIYNGFDARQTLTDANRSKYDGCLRLKYIGSLTEGQDFEQLVQLIVTALSGSKFELSFVGTTLSEQHRAILTRFLPGKFRVVGFLPHGEALCEMESADVLILLINRIDGFEGILTTKLFEYLASPAVILCLGPRGGEAEELINGYQAGACFDNDQIPAAAAYLQQVQQILARGQSPRGSRDVAELSAQRQALKLIDELQGLKIS